MIYNTIVIGGGPSGLFTAISIGENSTLLLEKNMQLGRKLLIAGSGRCNFTHSGLINDFFSHYGSNGKFLKCALKELSNTDLIDFFNKYGLKAIEDNNGKIFPHTNSSSDILSILLSVCKNLNITIKSNASVIGVSKNANLFSVITNGGTYNCKNLVIATGGFSYPVTGSTGDGYAFVLELWRTECW